MSNIVAIISVRTKHRLRHHQVDALWRLYTADWRANCVTIRVHCDVMVLFTRCVRQHTHAPSTVQL